MLLSCALLLSCRRPRGPARTGRVPHVRRVLGPTDGSGCVVRRADDVSVVRTPCTILCPPHTPPHTTHHHHHTQPPPNPVQLLGVDTPLALSCSFSRGRPELLCERTWAWAGARARVLCLSSCVQDWVSIGAVSEFVYPLLLDPWLRVRRTANGRMPVW